MTAIEAMRHLAGRRGEILKAELAGYLHVINRLDERSSTAGKRGAPGQDFNKWRIVRPEVKADFARSFDLGMEDFERWLTGQALTKDERWAARRLWRSRHVTVGVLDRNEEAVIDGVTVEVLGETWPVGQLATYLDIAGTIAVDGFLDRGTETFQLFLRSHERASKGKTPDGVVGLKTVAERSSVFGHREGLRWPDKVAIGEMVTGATGFCERRKAFIAKWRDLSRTVFADNRKPLNDVTAWEYGRAVAAFFKAAVAKVCLDEQWPDPACGLRWGLLGIGYPGLEFVGSAVRISDALARKGWLTRKLDRIQMLLEDSYPLGNEIYRDENGSIYLLGDSDIGREIAGALIDGEVEAGDDLEPSLIWEPENREVLPIWSVIERMKSRRPLNRQRLARWWQIPQAATVCPVCGIRPMASEGRAEERSLCRECFERRQGLRQSQRFLSGVGQEAPDTIWIDEVADEHGICALVTGRLEIEGWVEEDESCSWFRHLVVDEAGKRSKPPEFMRVQSAWTETKDFWEGMARSLLAGCRRVRFALNGDVAGQPHPTHVYEAGIGSGALSLVWDGGQRRFVTASNIGYLLRQIDAGAGETLETVAKKKRELDLRLPRGYEKEDAGRYEERDRLDEGDILFEFSASEPVEALSPYRPMIPILAEPRHFLAIVPASEAVGACKFVAEAYQERFGKVRSMLPLTLGAVFFDRRTPIYAVMQAGQKLLRLPGPAREWAVDGKDSDGWTLAAASLGRSVKIPTDDDVFFARLRLADGGSAAIKDLHQNQRVVCSLSLFDFLHLETTGHRYRLAYDNDGRRLDPERPTRAFTLEQMSGVEELWRVLATGLTTSQINELFAAAEQKREDWTLEYPIVDTAYREFCRALVRQAEWSAKVSAVERGKLPQLIAEGLLRDVVELHMKILKETGRKGE